MLRAVEKSIERKCVAVLEKIVAVGSTRGNLNTSRRSSIRVFIERDSDQSVRIKKVKPFIYLFRLIY